VDLSLGRTIDSQTYKQETFNVTKSS